MSLENTDKKTDQEVPLLFKGSALILLYVQVLLGRYQPPGLPTGPEPRLTKPQHTWNALPVRTRGGGGADEGAKETPFSFPTTLPPTLRAPPSMRSVPSQPPLTYPRVESPDPHAGSKGPSQT